MSYAYDMVKEVMGTRDAMRASVQGAYLLAYTKALLEAEKIEYIFTKSLKRYILIAKNDIYMFTDAIAKRFAWRNFTIYVRPIV